MTVDMLYNTLRWQLIHSYIVLDGMESVNVTQCLGKKIIIYVLLPSPFTNVGKHKVTGKVTVYVIRVCLSVHLPVCPSF